MIQIILIIITYHKIFQANKTALPIINLIEVMKPGVIDFSIVKQGDKLGAEVI